MVSLWQRRRGYRSALALGVLLLFTLPAEYIANDRPLVINYSGYWYFPVTNDYPETAFGGDFATYADYSDTYLREQIEKVGWMLWPLIPYSYASPVTDLEEPAPTPPSARNWLGTDDRQRDVLAWLIYSLRTSLLLGIGVAVACGAIGVLTGRALAATFSYLPAGAVAILAALDMLGYGVPPGTPSLGALLKEGWMNPQAPWLGLTGFFALAIVLILLTLLGQAARNQFLETGEKR